MKRIAILAVAAAGCAACSSGAPKAQAPATTPPPATTAAATSPTPSTTPSPTGSPKLAVGSPVTGAGTAFEPPLSDKARVPYSSDCSTLISPGFTQNACVLATSSDNTMAAVVETAKAGGGELDVTFRKDGNSWAISLLRVVAKPKAASRLSKVDLDGDGVAEAVFASADGQLDVVKVPGKVVVHLALGGGFAQEAAGGGIDAYVRTDKGYTHDLVRYLGKQWVLESQDPESTAQAQAVESGAF